MTRLNRIIKSFNDYDNLIKELLEWFNESDNILINAEGIVAKHRLSKIQDDTSLLISELKRYGCRREK